MARSDIMADILADIRVELADEFDQNFIRRRFFDGPKWKARADGEESTLQGSGGKLRKSLRGRVSGYSVIFSSSEPYAAIQNAGGKIKVTAKMRRFFWAMYYKNGKAGAKADVYRALALKPIDSYIVIPQRQYIGQHARVTQIVEQIVTENVDRFTAEMAKKFKQK